MQKLLFVLLLAVSISACQHSKKATVSYKETETQKSGSIGGNGLSIEEAIVIDENNETDGVAAEYNWLKANYPGYSLIKQSLTNINGKPYDKMEIKTAKGDKKTIYFDISNFFGKF